eukprot:9490668-Pyramimonas_sp.AAC.1
MALPCRTCWTFRLGRNKSATFRMRRESRAGAAGLPRQPDTGQPRTAHDEYPTRGKGAKLLCENHRSTRQSELSADVRRRLGQEIRAPRLARESRGRERRGHPGASLLRSPR